MIVEAVPPAEVLAAIRAPLEAGGGTRVNPPVLQPLGLLLDLLGEAMRARLFTVGGEGVEDACLRPDFTVAVAREHLALGPGMAAICTRGPRSGRPRRAPSGRRSSCRWAWSGSAGSAASATTRRSRGRRFGPREPADGAT
jgi:hypothetical protein